MITLATCKNGTGDWGGRGGLLAKKYRATSGGDENVLKLTVIMVTQFY